MSGESGQRSLRWPLRITQDRRDGVLVLALAGRVGSASALALTTILAAALRRGDRRLVLDLALVDYISSPGLTALETAADRCASARGELLLCAVVDPVRIALDLAGLLSHFGIEPTREQAVARMAKGGDAALP